MAIIFLRRRRKLTRTDCIILGVVTVFITVMLTYAAVSEYLKGTINVAGPIVMPLVSIPWPIFFFSKAKSLRKAEEKKRADHLAQNNITAEAIVHKQAQQPKLTPEEQQRIQKEARLRAAYLQSTRTLTKVPIVIRSPAGEYTATDDFVICWHEEKVCCFPTNEHLGLLLGKFEFQNRLWRFTNLAPADVKTELGSMPPMASGESHNVIPFPCELLYHTGSRINAITSISAGWMS